eukprot:Nk52_evm33s2039 gene=Nk52_evmTU33s2039
MAANRYPTKKTNTSKNDFAPGGKLEHYVSGELELKRSESKRSLEVRFPLLVVPESDYNESVNKREKTGQSLKAEHIKSEPIPFSSECNIPAEHLQTEYIREYFANSPADMSEVL